MSNILKKDIERIYFIDWFIVEMNESGSAKNPEFIGKWTEEETIFFKQSLVNVLDNLLVDLSINRKKGKSPTFRWTISTFNGLKPMDFIVSINEDWLADKKVISAVYGIRIPEVQLGSKSPSNILNEYKLSKRELEILDLVILGKTNKEIGKLLFISEFTVDGHRSKIYQKLGVHSFKELVRKMK